MPDYRPVPESDRDEFRRLLTYAFRPTERYDPDEDDEEPKPAQPGDRRGIYDGDELLCTGRHHWFTLDIRGEPHAVGGVSAVSTPPQNRRRGLVRQLLAESLAEYRDREHWFSALWPFEYAFYRKFGWATTSKYAETTFVPDALSFVDGVDPVAGEFRELSADDWEAMESAYRAANDRGLSMHRTEEWWRKRALTWWESEPYAYGWERDDDLRGYLVYDVTDDDGTDGRTMRVNELCAADHEARLELLRFCRYHDSQVKRVELYGPVDTTLQDLVSDPREVEVGVNPGPMSRLVDVERALEALSYPDGASGSVTLAVTDDLAGWNDDTYRLTVEDGEATCGRTDEAPDVRADVGTLSQVAVGYHPVGDAQLYGDLTVETEGTAETLSALFPPEETFLREGF